MTKNKGQELMFSWVDVERMVAKLAWSVKSRKRDSELEFVTGDLDGGLVPAVMLSHHLGLPLAFHYGLFVRGLWVSGIYRSGHTNRPRVDSELLETACLVSQEKGVFGGKDGPEVNYLAELRTIEPEMKIVFPWELVPPEGFTGQWGHPYPYEPSGLPLTELLKNGAGNNG
jgi:hypothetical protein